MDRLSFLRSMLGNTALLTLPPLALLPKEEQDRLAWTKDCHLVFVFDTYVRGFQYHAGKEVLPRMKDEDILDLVREYDNEHDPNAVAVYWEGHKLGYLPMGENVSLAYMLDHGLLLECSVVYTQPDADPWEQCFIAVHLLMPRNPSFDAYIEHYMARPDAGFKRRPEFGGMVEGEDDGLATVKQQAALTLLGDVRFTAFVQAAAASSEERPISISWLKKELDSSGTTRMQRLLRDGAHVLEVCQPDPATFRIRYGYGSGDVGDGAEWDVRFAPDGSVERIEARSFWMT